ncbi:MAG: hypothetical protein IKL54_00345 [Bacteroidaceae bacterium]|nr:hypothetical protein [Bacteroidaceae bacterium]
MKYFLFVNLLTAGKYTAKALKYKEFCEKSSDFNNNFRKTGRIFEKGRQFSLFFQKTAGKNANIVQNKPYTILKAKKII